MIHVDVLQGSSEWFRARIGIPTASEFHKILTPKTLRLSAQADAYMCRLLAEWLLDTPFEQDTLVWSMEQGIEREQEAVDFYELTYQAQTTLAGCCLTDDRSVGASPDRFVGTEGLLEIKCPLAPTHVSYLLADSLPDDYRLQLQGQLFVTQRQWCDFLSYYPGLPPLLVRVSPDRQVQHALAEALAEFILKLECAKAHLKELMP